MSTNANKETHGCELFDAYLTAKKAFGLTVLSKRGIKTDISFL